jgi:uncharacterized membrane protein YhaH (DUF805 family)
MNYYFEVLKKYAVFSGRARRKEYWYFFLGNVIFGACLGFLEGAGLFDKESSDGILKLYEILVLLPCIGVGIRRMHDINKSGWFSIIPIYNLILSCTDGTKGPNKYGPDPKENDRTTATNASDMKFCMYCGVKNNKDAKFCVSCGKSIS